MSQFINLEDFDASMHREVLSAITRDDETIIEMCIQRSLSQIRGYVSGRYNCDKIFTSLGDGRHRLILMHALDLTIYHLLSIHNPQKMTQLRKDRYDEAITYLEGVSRGRLSYEGAPRANDEIVRKNAPLQARSNPKRQNRL